MGAGVDDKIDLFVERILARMVIDDGQRAQIEPEIRNHLDEAVQEAEDRGWSREDAEHEAMLLFGQPSVIASYFRPTGGLSWYIFERTAFIGLLGFFLFGFPLRGVFSQGSPLVALGWALFVIFGLANFEEIFRSRARVNGGLEVKRPFRRRRRFRFEDIQSVEFGRGHLFGSRYIKIVDSRGSMSFATDFPGMRAGGLALAVLASATMSPGVRDYLRSIRTKIKAESAFFKISISCAWGISIIALLIGFRPMLQGEGYPWGTLVGGTLALLTIFIQGKLHVDRSKKGLCWLIAIAMWLTFLSSSAAMVVVGNLSWSRINHLVFFASTLLPLPIVWWRWRRISLAGLVGAILLVSILGALSFGPVYSRFEVRVLAQNSISKGVTSSFTWLPDDAGAAWIRELVPRGSLTESATTPAIFDGVEPAANTNLSGPPVLHETSLTIGYRGRDPIEYMLPGVAWRFFPRRHSDELMIIGDPYHNQYSDHRSALYSVDREGRWEKIETIPQDCSLYSMEKYDPWSPDRRYLLLDLPDDADTSGDTPIRVVFDLEGGEATRLGESSDQLITRWTDESSVEVISVQGRSRHEVIRDPLAQATVSFTLVNLESGESQLIREIEFEPGEHLIRHLGGGRLLTIFPSSSQDTFRPTPIRIRYTNTGEHTDLPTALARGINLLVDYADGDLFAYVAAAGPETGGPSIILANPDGGIIDEKPFRPDEVVTHIYLAPDGETVFYLRSSKSPMYVLSGIPQPEIWNRQTGETGRTAFLGGLWGNFFALMSGAPFHFPLWSPDSRKLAYETTRWGVGGPYLQIESVELN